MAIPSDQTAFSAGEIAPELYGQVDLKKFSTAATTMRNVLCNYRGGAMSRGGLAFVGRCLQNPPTPPRPIPFQFSINQGYVLEFGDHYVRFVFQGGYILEAPITITGATQANPCVIDVSGTPFSNGDWVFIQGVPGLLDYAYVVAAATSGHFSITDLDGNPIDSTLFPAYVSGGTVSRLYTVSTPYLAIDLPYLKFAQTADVMSLTLSNPATGNEYPPYDLTRLAADDWTLIQTDFDAVILPPASVSASATAQTPVNGTPGSFAYQVTAVDSKGNESIGSAFVTVNGIDIEVEGGTNIVTWSISAGASFYNIYRSPCAVGSQTVSSDGTTVTGRTFAVVPPGSIMGFVGSSYGTQFADTASTADLQQTPPIHQDPFAPGQILAVEITSQGSGLSGAGYTITTAFGTDFAGYPIIDSGQLGGFAITDAGQDYQPGDTIAFNGVGFASGSIAFGSTNPSANDTITLNGVAWTFVAAPSGGYQTQIGATLSATLQSLGAGLSSSVDPLLTVAGYVVDAIGGNLLVTYKTAGTGGNAYTLAASRATPSSGTLSGGAGSGYAGAAASGTLTFGAGNPSNGQTIILDGVTWTFVSSGASGNQTNLAGSLPATLTQLAIDLNASANASIALASYAGTSTKLDIAYKTVGPAGNAYTLAAGTAGTTPSAATLTGGLPPSAVPAATLVVGPESGTYPGVNTYFQQRHFFANSLNDPDTFWATQTGLYKNMDISVPTVGTDAITDSPWTEQVNGIQWLVPMPGGLLALTGSRAWQLLGAGSYQLNSAAITPASVEAQPQAFNGCNATVPPIVIDHEVLYVEVVQTVVRDLSWNFWVNIYTGADLTVLSSHLFLFRKILQWTWARNPYKVVWSVCDDGIVLALTYLKEQEVYGWTRHDTSGLIVGVASVTEPPANAAYFVVQRNLGQARGGSQIVTQPIFITATGTSIVEIPEDWGTFQAETLGAGGGGANGASVGSTGGEGGGYSLTTGLTLTGPQTCIVGVGGVGGTVGNGGAGGDTSFGGLVYGASVCAAKGGLGGVINSGSPVGGGNAALGIGTQKQSGGQGGPCTNLSGGGGGGGAGGPLGDGGNGCLLRPSDVNGNGGGGNGGGSDGAQSTAGTGGAGGNNHGGTGGGATSGAAGANGGGGAGGLFTVPQPGGAGGAGVDLDAAHGGGGGGGGGHGGASSDSHNASVGGAGGLYGGAGAAGGAPNGFGSAANGGAGAQGMIKLTGTSPRPSMLGIYTLERMDNRLWQSVEDTYAVDSGVSNPMETPAANLFASATSGTGITFTADQNVFAVTDVGRILRMSGGIATVTAFTGGQIVTGTWVLAATNGVIGLPYAASGDWTLATPVTTLNAPWIAGRSVMGLADGVVIGPLTVGPAPFGLITLPFQASNVKVGLSFTAQLQTPYLNGQQVVQGGRKVIPAVTLRLSASGPCQYGTNQPDGGAQSPQQIAPPWTGLVPVNTLMATGGQSPPMTYTSPGGKTVTQLWTGDIRVVGAGAAWNSKGQVAVQQSLPLPLEIVSIEPEVLDGDLPERAYSQGEPGRGPPERDPSGQQEGARPPGPWMVGPRI